MSMPGPIAAAHMGPEHDAAAELERTLARRVHLLAVALVGSSCLMYLAWLLTRPPSNAASPDRSSPWPATSMEASSRAMG